MIGMGWVVVGTLVAASACELSLTVEPATYEDLDDSERSAADRVFARIRAFDERLRRVSAEEFGLGRIAADRDRVDVSVSGIWVLVNLGDDRVHLTTWENLAPTQRERWGTWFAEGAEAASARYRRFFYEYAALHLVGIQSVYSVQDVGWVYRWRSMFMVERDAQRMVVTYLAETEPDLADFARRTCSTIRAHHDDVLREHYDGPYYRDHVRELADPDDPSGYFWFLCMHAVAAEARRVEFGSTFAAELEVLVLRRTGEY